ncbi:MAG: hypothetical protein ABI386_01090 [Rhodanobacter sp.]
MTKHGLRSAGKFAAISLAVAAAAAIPLSASARGWGGGSHHGGHGSYHGSYRGHVSYRGYGGYQGGYYRHGGYWSGGRWIGGAIVAGAVVGLVANALNPGPGYYDRPVAYAQPGTVIYENAPPGVTRRVVETRTVTYEDPYRARYIRDDGYGQDDSGN